MEERLECFDVDPLIDIDSDGRWAQVERTNEGAKFACDRRRLPAQNNATSISCSVVTDRKAAYLRVHDNRIVFPSRRD